MAFTAYAGSSGRFSLVSVVIDANTDEITFTGDPASVQEIVGWKISDSGGTVAEKLTFESDANDYRILFPTQLVGGTGRWTAAISAVDSATVANLQKGQPLVVDFIVQKGADSGRHSANCKIESVDEETNVTAQHATRNFTVVGSGVLPAFVV